MSGFRGGLGGWLLWRRGNVLIMEDWRCGGRRDWSSGCHGGLVEWLSPGSSSSDVIVRTPTISCNRGLQCIKEMIGNKIK